MNDTEFQLTAVIALARKLNISPEEFADMTWGAVEANSEYMARVIKRLEQLKLITKAFDEILHA